MTDTSLCGVAYRVKTRYIVFYTCIQKDSDCIFLASTITHRSLLITRQGYEKSMKHKEE